MIVIMSVLRICLIWVSKFYLFTTLFFIMAAQDDVLVECDVTVGLGTKCLLLHDFNLPTLNCAVDI